MLINETSFDLTKIYLDTSNSMAHIRMPKYEFFNNSILVKFLNLIEAKFNENSLLKTEKSDFGGRCTTVQVDEIEI